MSEEKPLHVRVAEALGWTAKRVRAAGTSDRYVTHWCKSRYWSDGAHDEYTLNRHAEECVPAFDTDWSVTGPLIERYGITLIFGSVAASPGHWIAEVNGVEWYPYPTPLLAVCHLILNLHAAGKLREGAEPTKEPA